MKGSIASIIAIVLAVLVVVEVIDPSLRHVEALALIIVALALDGRG